MKSYNDLIRELLPQVKELFPWDLDEKLQTGEDIVLVDIREPYEFDAMHIDGSMNVPRGVLESACDYGYEETVPELVASRERPVVLMCRSGNRSVLAAHTLQLMGFQQVYSLKTGLKGWNDYELPLVDRSGRPMEMEGADRYFEVRVRPDQLEPAERR